MSKEQIGGLGRESVVQSMTLAAKQALFLVRKMDVQTEQFVSELWWLRLEQNI